MFEIPADLAPECAPVAWLIGPDGLLNLRLPLISDLLDLSRLEAHRRLIAKTAVDVRALAEQITAGLSEKAQRRGCQFQVRVEPKTWVQADAGALEQLGFELYTGRGGLVAHECILDLRGFTAFTDACEPEEVMEVLGEEPRLRLLSGKKVLELQPVSHHLPPLHQRRF